MIFVRDDRRRDGCFKIAAVKERCADVYAIPYGTNELCGNVISIDDMDSDVWLYLESDAGKLRSMRPKRISGGLLDVHGKLAALGFCEYKTR